MKENRKTGIRVTCPMTELDGVRISRSAELTERVEKIVGILENHGVACENGSLTVCLDDALRNRMQLVYYKGGWQLILPHLGCAIPGQLEEQLSYGICAYLIRYFNPDEARALKTVEEIVCRALSVSLLRELGETEKAEEVLACGGTLFLCETERKLMEKSGDTEENIRKISGLLTWEDLTPFLRLRDYVAPSSVEYRWLDTGALSEAFPQSQAVQALCRIGKRIESDTDDLIDYMMSDPYPD